MLTAGAVDSEQMTNGQPSALAPDPSSLASRPSSLASHPSPLVPHPSPLVPHPSPLVLRRVGWEIGAERAADSFVPAENHVGLAMVSPGQGFAHWRLLPSWIDDRARECGDRWRDCRMVLRLYDVSYVAFNGLNANHIQDHGLASLCGEMFFSLPRPGTWQLAEIGFLLRSGEFLPAARSQVAAFARDSGAANSSRAGLLVDGREITDIDNVWDQERILRECRRPKPRQRLRIATCAFAEEGGRLPRFVTELAAGQAAQGHEVHLLVAVAGEQNVSARTLDLSSKGVEYHLLELPAEPNSPALARAFARAAQSCLERLAPFDLIHLHEWMTGLVPRSGLCPVVLSVTSIEATRRNGTPLARLSLEIEEKERETMESASLVLTPPWLRDQAVKRLGLNGQRVRAFPMEGRLPNEWELPLDPGAVKMEIGFGPLDRLLLFVGPLEYAAGVDVLLEAMPVLLQRWPNLRLAYVGAGEMHGELERRAGQLGVHYAVRLLGHVEGPRLTRLLRSALALVLPSRYRVPFDDAVVDLARCAGRPVITTHGGPAHLVRHEETGLVTYDNPGSMVWAVDRLLGDAAHADHMGQNGRRRTDAALAWNEVARHYLQLCAEIFPELTTQSPPGERS